ncbi:ThiF family adenylyltransferase, partial [Blautia sp. MSK22_86]|uniref:ThiF family adenylyltransferase n=1 Tax=Blautia sp. MSK22_86 TaxID=2884906 RepID=UPI001D1196AE
VGSLTLIDHEKVTFTNIGSKVLALHSTLGMSKVEAGKKRIRDIDENILVHTYETFYNAETAGMFELRSFDDIV